MKYYLWIVLDILLMVTIYTNWDEMLIIDRMWEELIVSQNEVEEKKHIYKLKNFIEQRNGVITMFALDGDGNHVDFQTIMARDSLPQEIRGKCYWNDKAYTGEGWHPICRNHIKLLHIQ